MTHKRYRLYTGPCNVESVANHLKSKGYAVFCIGTEWVYFNMAAHIEQRQVWDNLKADGLRGYLYTDLQPLPFPSV